MNIISKLKSVLFRTEVIPKPDQIWIRKCEKDNPFLMFVAEVVDVKNGWVSYRTVNIKDGWRHSVSNDSTVDTFNYTYKLVAGSLDEYLKAK